MRCLVFALVLYGAWSSVISREAEPAADDLHLQLRSTDETARLRAIDTLASRGAKIPDAVIVLTARLADPSAKVRVHAAEALAQMGAAAKEAGPALGRLLGDPNIHVRRAAIRALHDVRPDAAATASLVMKAVDDPDPAVRLGALDVLAELGKGAVPSLAEALRSEKNAYWACLALGEMGADAAPATAELQRLLRTEPRVQVRREAAMVLGAIGPDAAPAVPLLIHTLSDRDQGLQMAAVFALGRIGAPAKKAEAALRKLISPNSPPLVRILVVWALARVNPDDEQLTQKAVAVLSEEMKNKDAGVRSTAVRGLVDFRGTPDVLVPPMTRIIEQGPQESRLDALGVLQAVGEPAVPTIVKALKFPEVRMAAMAVLGRIGQSAKEAVPALVDVVKSSDARERRQALLSLGAMGPAARAAVPAATQAIRDADPNVRYAACYALGKMGVTAMDARPVLQQQLDSKDQQLALSAAWALMRIDPDCARTPPKALPMLQKALSDPDAMVRLEAASSIRCLGPHARPAAAALRTMAKEDPNELVRDMAGEALKAMEE